MAITRARHVLPIPRLQPSLASLTTSFSSSSSSSQPHLPSLSNQNPPSEPLISSVVSILTSQRSKSRWNFLKSLHPTGFSPAEFSQIALRIKNNPHLALRFFHWSQHNSLCNHNLFSYSTIIHILARSRRFKTLAQTLIQTAIRSHESNGHDLFKTLTKTYSLCDSAPFVFDLLIRACLHTNAIDRAVEIARFLRSRGIYPTAATCNSVIRSAARSRGSAAGLAIYREVFGLDGEKTADSRVRIPPNAQTFNTLMLSFYREQDMEGIAEIRSEMEKFGCQLNVFTYSVLITATCDGGKMEEAVSLWDEMRNKQIEPDIMAYNTLISGFCEMGEIEKAEALFREIEFGEIEPTCATFEHLIRGYCKIGDVDSALLLYKDMCRRDFRPEALTVDAVVRELCWTNRVVEGLGFLRDVKRRGVISPSRASYEFLIKGFCDAGEMEEALKIQAEMVGRGFAPDSETYSSFVEGYGKQGDIEKAMRLKDEMFELGLRQEDGDE
eukprot:TRINITY_DN2392_c0_g1_i1.p1 TRINITY_DN2392_c0_g1~~TRINITY_DN2392_c0_g1_i1.p1  ORF type:complete len:497 (-),score=72.76 TRINITY_DN2392_c0_g1_i1:1028-2518(-)